jgi:hypothetical protein
MVLLIESGDVTNRLAKIQGFRLPPTITPDRLNSYIEEASGSVLLAAAYTVAPQPETTQRQALDGLCLRMVLNLLRSDLFFNDASMLQILLREREQILKEAGNASIADAASEGGGFMFLLPGANP